MIAKRRSRRSLDLWPGFVDALATLLMVIVFVLMVFAVAQFFLGQALSGSERQVGVLEQRLAALQAVIHQREAELNASRDDVSRTQTHAMSLQEQIAALSQELARLTAALAVSEQMAAEQTLEIASLGQRLNAALAHKVEELNRYRSEFFGRLRLVLGNRPGIRVEGDRFVFQSELLFATGSADLGADGQKQLAQLAATLKEVSAQLPTDIAWVLRVDGHTDKVPIKSTRFPSNWELSTARAISVVKFLAAQGIPIERLAAAGFGEFQPLDTADSPAAYARNRRIELRLDQR